MSHKYMLLSNGPCKVPLKSDDNGFILIVAGQVIYFDIATESLFVYWLFQQKDRGSFSEHLRYCTKMNLTPMDIDLAINQFMGERTPIPVDEYRLEDVPLMADSHNGLCLLIPGYCCVISPQDEIKLMQMIIDEPYNSVMIRLRNWFLVFCSNYGLKYDKVCKGEQYRYLAESFLEHHGISPLPAKPKQEDNVSNKIHTAATNIGLLVVVVVIWGALAFGLLKLGEKMINECDDILGLMGVIVYLAGGALFCLPIYLLSKLKK